MSPRTGRPKAENPQRQKFSIRLDDVTGEKLDSYCKKVGKTRAVVIREAIMLFLDGK